MKIHLIVFLSVLCLGCSKQEDKQYLTISKNYFDLPNQSGTAFVNILSNSVWEVSTNNDWIIVVPKQGKGNLKLTLLIQPNHLNNDRQGVVSISYGKKSKQINLVSDIVIKQSLPRIENYQKVIDSLYIFTFAYKVSHDRFGQKSIDYALDTMGEDFYPTERGFGWFMSWYQYLEHRNINSVNLDYIWSYYYDIIENANEILNNIDSVNIYENQIDQKNIIKAQALIFRAHSYYTLIQLFAERYNFETGQNSQLGVPLKLKFKNEPLHRESVENVYRFINEDLQKSIQLMNNNQSASILASKLTINCAYSISARVALTTGNWNRAIEYAIKAIEGKTIEKDYTYGFHVISTEWIWGARISINQSSNYASFFSHVDPNFGGYATLGNHRLISTSVYSFMNDTDVRKSLFRQVGVKPLVGFKFTGRGDWTNDYLYIKAGEMYLIEAEAEARRGNNTEAQNVLFNLISKRDPGYVKSTLTGTALIDHIIMHRRADLWGEGQRFLDIKRLNKGMDRRGIGHNETLWNAASNFPAGDKNFVFLIPKQEIDANPNMVQNPL